MIPRKFRIHAILIVTFLFIIIYPQFSNQPDEHKTTAATAAATEFLQLIDAGEIDKSWQISAEYLRTTIPLATWQGKLTRIRADFGTVVQRQRSESSFAKPTADLPESEVIILTFASEFKKQADSTETVTLLLHQTSGWQVVGYFIK